VDGFGEPCERGAEHGDGGGLEGGHAQPAADVARVGGQLGLGLFEPGEHGLGVLDEAVCGGGEPDAAADALEQPKAGFRLELGELL
jgi:hypothetical protein